MSIEVELKFRVADNATLAPRIEEAGGRFAHAVVQQDVYFAHPSRDFAVTDEAFRLRSVGDVNCLTYKGPHLDDAVKARKEIEIDFAAGSHEATQMRTMLQALGFREVRAVVKRRSSYQLQRHGRDFSVELDTIDGLGEYVEIETMAAPEEMATARDAVLKLAEELGLKETERRSYLELMLQQDRQS